MTLVEDVQTVTKDSCKNCIDYNDIHRVCAETSKRIMESEFHPELILAIDGGGFIPARIMRTFLKVPIKTVSLELYDDKINKPGENVNFKQWINESDVKDKRVLVVDEVDDTRITLHFCIEKLRLYNPSKIGIFVIHNKIKPKKRSAHWDDKEVERDTVNVDHYWAGVNVPDVASISMGCHRYRRALEMCNGNQERVDLNPPACSNNILKWCKVIQIFNEGQDLLLHKIQ